MRSSFNPSQLRAAARCRARLRCRRVAAVALAGVAAGWRRFALSGGCARPAGRGRPLGARGGAVRPARRGGSPRRRGGVAAGRVGARPPLLFYILLRRISALLPSATTSLFLRHLSGQLVFECASASRFRRVLAQF